MSVSSKRTACWKMINSYVYWSSTLFCFVMWVKCVTMLCMLRITIKLLRNLCVQNNNQTGDIRKSNKSINIRYFPVLVVSHWRLNSVVTRQCSSVRYDPELYNNFEPMITYYLIQFIHEPSSTKVFILEHCTTQEVNLCYCMCSSNDIVLQLRSLVKPSPPPIPLGRITILFPQDYPHPLT